MLDADAAIRAVDGCRLIYDCLGLPADQMHTKLILESGLQLPFASYSGKHVVWYAGWQPSGFFGLKFNLHNDVGR